MCVEMSLMVCRDHSHDYERVGAPPLVKQRRPRESSVRSAYAELPLSPSSPGGQPFCCGIPSRSKSKYLSLLSSHLSYSLLSCPVLSSTSNISASVFSRRFSSPKGPLQFFGIVRLFQNNFSGAVEENTL